MYHSFFFMRQLSAELAGRIIGWEILECFSQNKDELIIGIGNPTKQLFLKCALNPEIGIISFSEDFHRAKKNSINLFNKILGKTIQDVVQVSFDRSFYMLLEGGYKLLFKMHGRRSNILLLSPEDHPQLFRGNLQSDLNITLENLSRNIELEDPKDHDIDQLRLLLGKLNNPSTSSKEDIIATTQSLFSAKVFSLSQDKAGKPEIRLQDHDPSSPLTDSAIEASNLLGKSFTQEYFLEKQKAEIRSQFLKRIKSTDSYLSKAQREYEKITKRRSFEELANIVMANLHLLPPNGGEQEVLDFYNDENILIKIKPGLSPQKYAENLYRKSKNQKIELQKISENIEQKHQQLASYKSIISALNATKDFKELKAFKKEYAVEEKKEVPVSLPYYEFLILGYKVWVGKNAKANDELTLKFSQKNDLWLHARDVPGSHVLIKGQTGKTIPNPVIESAASLAAYFSKRRSDSLCPVIVTPKKYVRKKKGSPPGLVFIDKEEVVMVKPQKPAPT